METLKKFDNPGDCQTTGTVLLETANTNKPLKNENQNANIESVTATTKITVKHATSTITPVAANKLKFQQQQHQFRAPQQFVKHKKTSSSSASSTTTTPSPNNGNPSTATAATTTTSLNNNKKNKCWNKRQHRTTKQNNTTTIDATSKTISNNSASSNSETNSTLVVVTDTTRGGTENENEAKTNLSALSKADLENIQNLKNQVGGHYQHHHHNNYAQHHHYNNQHHGAVSNIIDTRMPAGQGGFPPSCLSAMASEKLGYGHGHCKPTQQQLHKKPLPTHRSGAGGGLGLGGNHHHILCAGAALNTLGAGGPGAGNAASVSASNLTCCHINGCPSHNTKEANSSNNSTASNNASALHICCLRSKFFLPDKRPRKGNFIPPTKFLLGGNISDPLNLSSLQNEVSNVSSSNNTPATTPRQSPITTPPKVEVIIPPNIHDPLHLLDPVDSMEYEKQLTSPMKRGLSSQASLGLSLRGGQIKTHKHRHRKNRKPKRRRYDSLNSTTSTTTTIESLDEQTSCQLNNAANNEKGVSISMDLENICKIQDRIISANSADSEDEEFTENELLSPQQQQQLQLSMIKNTLTSRTTIMYATCSIADTANAASAISNAATLNTATEESLKVKIADQPLSTTPVQLPQQQQELQQNQEILTVDITCGGSSLKNTNPNINNNAVASATALPDIAVTRERACRDLHLDLVSTTANSGSTTTTSCGSSVVSVAGGGRKRKISESNSQKSKVS